MTTATREKPILFSAPMVQAILDGRKTQTRRVVKPQPDSMKPLGKHGSYLPYRYGREIQDMPGVRLQEPIPCPYGAVGDVLWVRETWAPCIGGPCEPGNPVLYRANMDDELSAKLTWKPSIHMPRWASRLTLEITGVRVERLQAISEADAIAEGAFASHTDDMQQAARVAASEGKSSVGPVEYFRELWHKINAKRGYSWELNPWVFVIEFRRIESST